MNLAKAYTGFTICFFIFASIPCIFRAMTDASGSGLFLGKQTANAFGVFRINWFHAVLHMALAAIGFTALENADRARQFGRLNFVVCAILVVIGRVSPNGTRHIPANGPSDLLNAAVGGLGFLIGFTPLAYKTIALAQESGGAGTRHI